jgi:lipopolysaccharide heptosyltransferase II
MATSPRTSLITALGSSLRPLFPVKPPPTPRGVRKLLVVKPAALGDVLLATPALSALRRAFPTAALTLAVGRWSKPAVEGNPDVDEILDCGSFGTPGRYGWRETLRFARAIGTRGFDLAVVLDRAPRVALAPCLAGIPHRAGIDSGGRGFALTVRVPWERPRHEADLMLDVVRALGVDAGAPPLKFVPGEEHYRFADRVLEEWGLAGRYPLVIVHPGGASNPGMVMPEKRWPAPRFAAVADRLVEEMGAKVVIVGHGADAPLARQMRLSMRHPAVDLVGQTASFGQLAALLQRSHLYVGNNSSPLHLAEAVGTPVVGIFGPTDPAMFGPFRGAGVGLVDASACSQTTRFTPGPLTSCPNCRCIERVTVDQAVAAAAKVLTAVAPQQSR